MTYSPPLAWATLGGGTLMDRPAEFGAWRSIITSAESYPTEDYHPPLRAPRRAEGPRKIGALSWTYASGDTSVARLIALQVSAGEEQSALSLVGADSDVAAALDALLHRPALQGRMLATWGGADGVFHAVLRQLVRPLVARGFTVEPIASGARCKALILRKGRRSWWLTDAQEMIGGVQLTRAQFVTEYSPRSPAAEESPERLAAALGGFQRQLVSMFGVALRATIGAAALRAASAHIPPALSIWRPSPLMVAMLRAGHGFRGGYSHGELYDGPAHRADMNKAYTASLALALPARAALVPAGARWDDKPGVYLCTIEGPGIMPIYVAPYSVGADNFKPEYWNGIRCVAVLASTEINGIRALGYTVRQGAGFAFTATWSLERFAARIAAICSRHGRGSAHERTAKVVGNAVYGKLAENPERDQIMYAQKRPGDAWHPMVDSAGAEVPDLWTTRVVVHRPGQHVDVAATVTGRVRGWLYEAAAVVDAMGGRVVHADTDGLLATVDPSPYLITDESRPGSWRIDAEPQRAIVWGHKAYAYGDDVRAAGFAGLTVDDAAALQSGAAVPTTYTEAPAPWRSDAGAMKRTRTARRSAG